MISESSLKFLQHNVSQTVNLLAAVALHNEGGRGHDHLINTCEYDNILVINKEYKQAIFVIELLNIWVAQINKACKPFPH